MLFAAGIAESMLPDKPGKRDKAVIVIDKQQPSPPIVDPAPAGAQPDQEADAIPRQDNAQKKKIEIRESRWDISLPPLVVLLVIFMLIVRLLSKSKLKAEGQAAVARDVAERETLSRQLAEARLQAMQAQVEPHFLFNTLAAVEHLIETDPPRAAQMQRNLIGYLRSVLPNFRKPDSTLGRETEICAHYLDILKMRMEDRLLIDIVIPEHLKDARLPPMMLQSLVENAIKHGLEPKPAGGTLYLRAAESDGQLAISVIDTGMGYDEQAKPVGGLGLSNVRERLSAMFGARGRLVITPNLPHGTQVRIELPYERLPK